MLSRQKKCIAIVDLDSCAYAPFHRIADSGNKETANAHKQGLSQQLLDDLKQREFGAFYVCTHRVTATSVPSAFDSAEHLAGMRRLIPDFNPVNGLTTNIIDNLVEASGLQCLAVSSPDDFFGATAEMPAVCGKGYEALIMPFEKLLKGYNRFTIAKINDPDDLIEPVIEDELYDFYELDTTRAITKNAGGDKTKNQQLVLLMRHACEQFPDHDLEFVFYDDETNICKNALQLNLHAGMSLEVWQHDACLQIMERKGRITAANVVEHGLMAPAMSMKTQRVNRNDVTSILAKIN